MSFSGDQGREQRAAGNLLERERDRGLVTSTGKVAEKRPRRSTFAARWGVEVTFSTVEPFQTSL